MIGRALNTCLELGRYMEWVRGSFNYTCLELGGYMECV